MEALYLITKKYFSIFAVSQNYCIRLVWSGNVLKFLYIFRLDNYKNFFFGQVTIFKDIIRRVDYYVLFSDPKFPTLTKPSSMNSAVPGPVTRTASALHPQIHIKSAE